MAIQGALSNGNLIVPSLQLQKSEIFFSEVPDAAGELLMGKETF